MIWALALACALFASATSSQEAEPSRLRLAPCGGQTCVVASVGQDSRDVNWSEALEVRTEASATSEPPGPTLFGSYALEGSDLVFRPRLPLLPGVVYRASLDLPSLERPLELTFDLPAESLEPPRVLAIHPATPTVPANLLRAYVEFSQPMRPDVVGEYLRLVDESGEKVDLPFVEIDGGLWDPQHTRLTLIFHPGRLKRGVAPREEQGPPMQAGRVYRLEIDQGWPAASGLPLPEGSSRSWTVVGEDREAVVPGSWKVERPRVGTREPLEIDFGEPLDHALALRMVEVVLTEQSLPGRTELSAEGTLWAFLPDAPWADADHTLRIHPALEDLAGNNLRGLFDRGEGQNQVEATPTELTFRPEA